MASRRTWIIARLEDGKLDVSVYGAEAYMDDDPVHRTRESTAHLDLMDKAGLRSAQGVVVPRVPGMTDEQLKSLDRLRTAAIPAPKAGDLKGLESALQEILDAYAVPLGQLTRRLARESEAAAYRSDSYDKDGNPLVLEREAGLTGRTTTSTNGGDK